MIDFEPIERSALDRIRGATGVGIIGCGYWGRNYVRVFNELAESRVVAVCDKDGDRLAEIEARFPGTWTVTGMEELLELPELDAVVVCTEASSHHDVVLRCLRAGKHVLVEKPITTTVEDADDLAGEAREGGLTLMVGHTFIYNAGIQKVKQYIDRGDVGQIYYLYASRTNLGPIRHDVNAVWDLAPHDVAIFNHLLGATPLWVSAVGVNVLRNGRVDVGFISLAYPNDVLGHIHVSWADPNKVREVVVVGSERRVAFNDVNPQEQVRIFEKSVQVSDGSEEFPFQLRDGDIISPRIEASEPLKSQSQHFLECINTGLPPRTGAREGRDVIQVMTAVSRSLEQEGAPVSLASVGGELARAH